MRCRGIAVGLLLAGLIAPGAGACNDALCTRSSECDEGFVCTPEARCEPAPDASASGGVDGGGVDAGTPSGTPDASSLDAGPPDAALPDAGIDLDADL
ncbi:MAG TPA: hypothetical protein VKB80_31250 [Kofleriaceae bacterium]|nr:hypothetical protein [Kofleriaceae bacterium]